MIQRRQTIWFLLAALLAFLYTRVPLYGGTSAAAQPVKFIATENLLLFAISIAIGLAAAVAIFLFKNRPTQVKLAFFGVLASIGLIALEVSQIEAFKTKNTLANATYAWGSLLPIAMVILFFMAASGVKRDQRLVKSLDRLR